MRRWFGALALALGLSLSLCGLVEAKNTYGLSEKVKLVEADIIIPAKMDTGAFMSSLNAAEIKEFTRDEKPWVSFVVPVKQGDHVRLINFEKPLIKKIIVRMRQTEKNQSTKKRSVRPVVQLWVQLGEEKRLIDVNLTDRHNFAYALLIGSDAIKKFDGMVDPALSFTHSLPPAVKTPPHDE